MRLAEANADGVERVARLTFLEGEDERPPDHERDLLLLARRQRVLRSKHPHDQEQIVTVILEPRALSGLEDVFEK